MIEESQKLTIESEAPILHDISLRLKHKSLHFVIIDPFISQIVDDELARYRPLLQSLPSSSVKTLTLQTYYSKAVLECDSALFDCFNSFIYSELNE